MKFNKRPTSDLDIDKLGAMTPRELVSLVESVIIQIGLEFGCKPVPIFGGGTVLTNPTPREPVMYSIRDSILFRAVSVEWHLAKLLSSHSSWIRALDTKTLPAGANRQDWVMTCRDQCSAESTFLFEDILFQIISLYDYVGRIVVYALQRDVDPKANWKDAHQYARNRSAATNRTGYTLVESIVAARIISHERSFVSKLADFRAEIYHRGMHLPDALRPGIRFPTMSRRIDVPVSEAMGRWLLRVVPGISGNNLSMHEVAGPLVCRALILAIDVLRYLLEDVIEKNARERNRGFFISEESLQRLRRPLTPFWTQSVHTAAVADIKRNPLRVVRNP